ncbi:replication initiator [Streptomyces paromomycinus]|uniref:Plasmid replication initiator protein n=1 Tax=Streptomyces paromomycinus TaxID=92743 RepID=A0A401WBW3_STREY|nr:plasmid replication initiator protein [Streptomyces paromomycinus]
MAALPLLPGHRHHPLTCTTTDHTRSDCHGRFRPSHPPCRCGGLPGEVPAINPDIASAGRRAVLERAARLGRLSETDRDAIRIVQGPQFPRWLDQVTATGGCANPIHLAGATTVRDAATGEILHHYDTRCEPGERLLVRCRNRRARVCAPCSHIHAGDTFHLVRAGLVGGKSVPADVRHHPRLFVTLTAPSFGPVHRATTDGARCSPRRDAQHCEHGHLLGCPAVHAELDPLVGQPLCPACYDYTGHVLWHAQAGRLWKAFTDNLHNHLAARIGLTRTGLRRTVRICHAKIAELQRRAAVHLHAVLRLDSADGRAVAPPAWGIADLLVSVIHSAARAVCLSSPYSQAVGQYELRWGAQLDARPLEACDTTDGPDADAVAAYVAKYVTKGAADTLAGADHRLKSIREIDAIPATAHSRTLMRTTWRLGGLPEYASLNLRSWTHTLGFRGHILTKSRTYSTTYSALREARAKHRSSISQSAAADNAITARDWRYLGSGHTPGGALITAGIAQDAARNLVIAREELTSRKGEGT